MSERIYIVPKIMHMHVYIKPSAQIHQIERNNIIILTSKERRLYISCGDSPERMIQPAGIAIDDADNIKFNIIIAVITSS